MLEKIQRHITLEPPKTPPPAASQERLPTPTTVRSTIRFAKKLGVEVLKRPDIVSREVQLEFIKFVKSTVVNATLHQEAEEELQLLQAATAARNKRQKPSRRVIQKGGVIYAGNACTAVNKRLEKEKEAAARYAVNKAAAAAKAVAEAQNKTSGSETSEDTS